MSRRLASPGAEMKGGEGRRRVPTEEDGVGPGSWLGWGEPEPDPAAAAVVVGDGTLILSAEGGVDKCWVISYFEAGVFW